MPLHRLVSLPALLLAAGCAGAVIQTQPNVREGGRAVAITVRPDDDHRMIVASETGGLFRTTDGGVTWRHLAGPPNNFVNDVAYASLGPGIVIATTRSRYRALNDGGIWRSTDGGDTWTQPAGSMPPTSRRCPSRPSAWDVSFQPLSRTVWVATDCGLAMSADNGVTWTHTSLDPSSPAAVDSLQNRVWSVRVLTRGSGVAAADDGMWFLSGTNAWTKAASGPTAAEQWTVHALAISPWSGSHYFHAGQGRQLWMTTDGGANWSALSTPMGGGRQVFVRVARASSGDDSKYDLYFGDGVRIHRQTFTHTAATPVQGSWSQLSVDHADPADIAFDVDNRIPILLATDGGLHLTKDKGAKWTFTGGGTGGYNALQITEITGQLVTGSSPHLDLYFGTQDNHIRASADGGATWPALRCCEGFFLRNWPTTVDHQGARFTGTACGGCGNFASNPHLASQVGWGGVPDNDTIPDGNEYEGTPYIIAPDAYVQGGQTDTAGAPFDFFITLSSGSSWSKTYSLVPQPQGPVLITGSPANPTVYQGIRRPGNIPNGGRRYGLMRIASIATTPVIRRADSTGIGSLGILPTMFAWYMAVGVDPNDRDHAIAADVQNGVMVETRDGGVTWQPMPQLTSAVTQNGVFLHQILQFPLAGSIAFDPYDSCHILVGTHQNGVIRSTDGGGTWARISGSTVMPFITSFYFPPTGRIWVSTYGRGLWRLNLGRNASGGRCTKRIRVPVTAADTAIVFELGTGTVRPFRRPGEPSICPRCQYVVVRDGWITALRTSGDSLREIAISGGSVAQVDAEGREVPLAVPNVYLPGDGRVGIAALDRLARPPVRIRAIVLDGVSLRAAILAGDALAIAPPRAPALTVRSATSVAGLPVVRAGERVQVTGRDFFPTPAPGSPVTLLVDGRVVARDVPVRADGLFVAEVVLQGLPGNDVEIVAEQRDGNRLTSERVVVRVVPDDRPEEAPRPPG